MSLKLRDYQERAVKAVLDSWKTARSCLVVLPTGTGKTVVMGEVLRRLFADGPIYGAADELPLGAPSPAGGGRRPYRVLVLAHREELVTQAAEKIGLVAERTVGIEMGPLTTSTLPGLAPAVVVSSVQTQITGRMRRFDPEEFLAVVIDEAHHATAQSYRDIVAHYFANPRCRLLGVTATPDRADRLALGNVFETVACVYSVQQAIDDGWLVPVRQRLVKVASLDYSRLSTSCGDFNPGELAQLLEEERNLHGIAAPLVELCGTKRAIVFAASVRQAERLAEILSRRGARAAWLCGRTDRDERRQTLADFKAGRLQFVVNCGVLTEGFDDAGVEIVAMARPTKSRALYAQMAGRATRPAADIAARLGDCASPAERRALVAASAKPDCLILDFVGNAGRHKLVSMIDILGGRPLDPDEDEAREIVRRKAAAAPDGVDVGKEIAEARAAVAARKAEDARRRAALVLDARYRTLNVDPFDLYDVAPADRQERSPLDSGALSFRERKILRETIGVDPDKVSLACARGLLAERLRRLRRNLATLRQTRLLRKFGIPVPMTFDEARETITRLLAARRKK